MARVLKPADSGQQQRVVGTDRQLIEQFPAVPQSVHLVRAAVLGFAREAGMSRRRLEALQLAVSEAATNVVRHAYPSGPGTMTITVSRASDELWVLVADRGCGHQSPSRDPGLGFGLGIIAHESDELVITERAEGGTELRMRFRLDREPADDRSSIAARQSSSSSLT